MVALVVCFDAGMVLNHEVHLETSVLLSELRMMPVGAELRMASQCLRTYLMQPVDAFEAFQNAEIPESKTKAFLEEMKAETVQKGIAGQSHLKKLFRHQNKLAVIHFLSLPQLYEIYLVLNILKYKPQIVQSGLTEGTKTTCELSKKQFLSDSSSVSLPSSTAYCYSFRTCKIHFSCDLH